MVRKLVLLLGVAVAFAACGDKEASVKEAETEGVYVDVGGLTYQVQLSRYLNPGDVEDKEYLRGLPAGTNVQLPGDEIWFSVWMRVKNYSDKALTPTQTFTIVDTEENEFRPISVDAATNPFVYQPITLQHAQVLPKPNTAATSATGSPALIAGEPVARW